MVLAVFTGMTEFERSLIVERTRIVRIAARARGVRFGRVLSSARTRSSMLVLYVQTIARSSELTS
jgi:DNA invertase Pin-like site-specific DNA recombinase